MPTRAAVFGSIALLLLPLLALSGEQEAAVPPGSKPLFSGKKASKGLDAAKRMKERFGTMNEDGTYVRTAQAPPAHSPPAPLIELTDPKAEQQIYLAATGPYNYLLSESGIRANPDGTYVDAQGNELTSRHIASLIKGEPRAPALYPGFFKRTPHGIPRSRYKELRKDYDTRPELRENEFKDVELSEDKRDFVGKKSCSPPECGWRQIKGVPSVAAVLNRIWVKIRSGGGPSPVDTSPRIRVDEYGIRDLSLNEEEQKEFAAQIEPATRSELEKKEKRRGRMKFWIWAVIGFVWAILLMRRRNADHG